MIRILLTALAIALGLVNVPIVAPAIVASEEQFTWSDFHADALAEYADMFTDLFNATEVKWSKNNRLMVKGANAKSFKFVAKGK